MKKFFALFLAFLTVISFASCGKNEPADIKEPDIPEISENPEVSEPEKTPEKPVEIGRRK